MSNPITRNSCAFFTSISYLAIILATAGPAAYAQEDTEDEAQDDSQRSEPVDEIIVTGVAKSTSKKDATFTINTYDTEAIQQLAPLSTADLLQNVPGIYAEGSTAGEASNNITVRGLPVTGGYRYAPQLIDGLPWFEEPEVQFMNNDVAVRADLMTEKVEVVKGGTGGILYSNGLGATVNHVTRTGKQEFEGGYRLEVADYNFVRNELFVSGPINDNLTFAVGGFYRTSDGIRDFGFTADDGGQIRANLLYTSDDGRTEIFTQAHFIRDKTAFYQNVPFQVPRLDGPGTAENPTVIDADTIEPIGIDFEDGTVVSPFTRISPRITYLGEDQIDISDGINPEFSIFTAKARRDFGDGWVVNAGVRHTNGTNGFNGMFTGNDADFAGDFLSARYNNDVVNPAFGAALACDRENAKLAGFFDLSGIDDNCTQFQGISRQDFIDIYAVATDVGGFFIDDGSRVGDNEIANFLLPFIADTEAESTSVDVNLQKSFELYGTHDLTVGTYSTSYSTDQFFQATLINATMETRNSRLFNMRGLDANGNVVGPSLTINSAILPGFFGYESDISVNGRAFYILDHWELMDRKLKIDAGFRWQDQDSNVFRRNLDPQGALSDFTPASVTPGSPQDTTADNEIFIPNTPRISSQSFEGTGWSLGANYSFSPDLSLYGLVSQSFRLPSLEDLNEFRVNQDAPGDQVENIWQYEAGVRYYYKDVFDTQIAFFYNEFDPRQQLNQYRDFEDPSCAATALSNLDTCPLIDENFQRGVKNIGVEIEAAWRPEFIEGLELVGNVVFQDPEIQDANFTIVDTVFDTNGTITGYEFVQVGEDGRTPRRIANTMLNVRGSYDLKPATGLPIKPYFKYTYFGERFSESTDFNVTLYPKYFHIDGGVIVDFNEDLALQVHASNITNELSFTEGDPIFFDLLGPDGTTNRGVGRPLFGRTIRASLTYGF